MDSDYYINKQGELCISKENLTKIELTVQGFYAPNWSIEKLDKYVLKWKHFEVVRGIRKAILK